MSRYQTPLRYPGGKQKLAPFIEEVLMANSLVGCQCAEVYAGGAGTAVQLLLTFRVSHIHLNDSCDAIYAFWKSLLTDTEEFCRRVSRASLSVEEWRRQREVLRRPAEFSRLDRGFSAFYLNRCNRSGILTGGLIGGINQTGSWKMDARFPRKELIRRIEAIASRGKSITVTKLDAEQYIRKRIPKLPLQSLIYFDPPYLHRADRLYLNRYSPEDHRRLATIIQTAVKRPWIVSYDNALEIRNWYRRRTMFSYDLQYSAQRAYRGSEILIFSDNLRLPKYSKIPSIDKALRKYAS